MKAPTATQPRSSHSPRLLLSRLGLVTSLLVLLGACEVTISEGDLGDGGRFGFGGTAGEGGSSSGSAGMGGSGGSAGTSDAGSSGAAGTSLAGSGGGEMTLVEPDAGMGPALLDPPPTCEAQAEDDDCLSCLKQQCCDAWLACNDVACAQEWSDTRACVEAVEFPDTNDYAICVSTSAVVDMLPQSNTAALLTCVSDEADADAGFQLTRCGEACYGTDIIQ